MFFLRTTVNHIGTLHLTSLLVEASLLRDAINVVVG